MTGEQLTPYVKAWAEVGGKTPIARVIEAFRCADAKARLALIAAGLYGEDAAVIEIGAVNAGS